MATDLRKETASANVPQQTDWNRLEVHPSRNQMEAAVNTYQEFHGASARGRIDTSDVEHLLYWMDLLHADAEMLKEAIDTSVPPKKRFATT